MENEDILPAQQVMLMYDDQGLDDEYIGEYL